MPTRVQLPGGDTATFPDGMSNEAIERVLREQYKPAAAAAAPAPKDEPVRGTLDRVIGGLASGAADLATGFGKVGSYAVAPVDLALDAATGRPLGTGHRERMSSIKDFAKEHGANNWTSVVNQAAPEVMATMGPMGSAVNAARAPFIVDVALNAALEGSKAAAAGEPIAPAATMGGLGAAGGRIVGRMVGGARPVISEDARRLVDADVIPSPGQMFGDSLPGRFIRSAEDKATSLPGVGDIIEYSRRRSLQDYSRAEINAALKPLLDVSDPIGQKLAKSPATRAVIGGAGVREAGDEGVEQAMKRISATYDEGLKGVHVRPEDIKNAVGAADDAMTRIPMLDDKQLAQIESFIALRMQPHMTNGLTGELAKQVDSEIGHYAREFSRSVNPSDHSLGEAYYALQEHWRDALYNSAGGKKSELIGRANQAYKQMLPVVKAADKAAAKGGVFTPFQMGRAAQQVKDDTFRSAASELTKAGQNVLPGTVPDSGTVGRLLLGSAVIGGTLIPGNAATTTGLAALAYSRPGMRLMLNGLNLPPRAREMLMSMAPEEAAQALKQLAQSNPQFAQHLNAQIGRVVGSQEDLR